MLEEVLKIADVKIAHAVTGRHDIIAYTDFVTIADLTRTIDKIQTVHGVTRTTSSIAMAVDAGSSSKVLEASPRIPI